MMPSFAPAIHGGNPVCVFLQLVIPFQPDEVLFGGLELSPVSGSQMPRFNHLDCLDIPVEEKKDCANKKMLEIVYRNLEYPMEARQQRYEKGSNEPPCPIQAFQVIGLQVKV